MKKILAAASSLALALSAMVAVPTPALAASVDGYTEYCRANAASFELTVGQCVSYFRSDDIAGLCRILDNLGYLQYFGWTNRGQCVSYLRTL